MPANSEAPLISENEKADTTDAYAFIDNNGFGGTNDASSTLEDTSLSDFYTLFVLTLGGPGVQATSTTHGTEATSAVEPNYEAEPDIASDFVFL
jgi:hypothetical protein